VGAEILVSGGPRLRSFAPVFRADARVLILGSMPGAASLAAAQYYAHPRNAFWPIMGALFDAGAELPYDVRLGRLLDAGIALWDVIGRCHRSGSLDSRIAADSVEPNDIAGLLAACPHIGHVFFNGGAAETAFRRHVRLAAGLRPLHRTRLPSTSPAHAARSLEAKLAAWQAVREALQGRPVIAARIASAA
jgi:hypoxanthine-DNA glycosylase